MISLAEESEEVLGAVGRKEEDIQELETPHGIVQRLDWHRRYNNLNLVQEQDIHL